jgi:hypothetical protein
VITATTPDRPINTLTLAFDDSFLLLLVYAVTTKVYAEFGRSTFAGSLNDRGSEKRKFHIENKKKIIMKKLERKFRT